MNTPHETVDSIEHSAYDSAMSEEVKSWEVEFDERFCSFNLKSHNLCSKCKPFDGSSVADGYGSADEYIKDFIRTQRSLAQQEILDSERKRIWSALCDLAEPDERQFGAGELNVHLDEVYKIINLSTLKDTNI